MEQKEWITLEGSVLHIVYANRENGYTVLELDVGKEYICVVGNFAEVSEGEWLRVTGYYTTHPTYGQQFAAQVYEQQLPATAAAIRQYLASGVIKGIGSVLAGRIVDHFGDDTLKILEEDPKRLAEVRGISPKRCEEFIAQLQQVFGVRTLMLFLAKYGVTPAQAVTVWKKWGSLSMRMLRQDPYCLCEPPFSLPFGKADQMAVDIPISPESTVRIVAGLRYVLRHNAANGHTCLPCDRLTAMAQKLLGLGGNLVEDGLDQAFARQALVLVPRKKPYAALPEYFTAEQYIAGRVSQMLVQLPSHRKTWEKQIRSLEQKKKIRYGEMQKEAIFTAMEHAFFVLTGGPGTGKTTTLRAIVELFEAQGKTIAAAAPTGRAAKRMSEVTGQEAKTIHRLLEAAFGAEGLAFTRNEQTPLAADVVLVDETSMVDVLLLEALLRALKPGGRLILVGDYHQLPSVGAGNVLHDLLQMEQIPSVQLNEIFRQAAESLIVCNAHQVVMGCYPDLTAKDKDCFFLKRTSQTAALQTVLELVCRRLPASYGFSARDDIQVLSPQRKGDLGVMSINQVLQQQLNPPSPHKTQHKTTFYTYRVGDKVMQIRNNYDIEWKKDEEVGLGIFNGDIGIIQMIDLGSKTMAIDFEGRLAYYSFDMLHELELAYAMTVHKSQGNEFEAVILPVLQGFPKLYYRNLLYTAMTRAKKLLIFVGEERCIRGMVDNNLKSVRFTNLRYFLKELADEATI